MLLREYAIKWLFAVPPLLTNISALPGETWTWTPEIVFLQSCCIPCLENDTGLAWYVFDMRQPILITFFVDNKLVLLSTVSTCYFLPSHFVFDTWYAADTVFGVRVSPCSVRRGGITNHCLIAYSLSNVSAENTVDLRWSYNALHQCRFLDTV